MQVAAVLKCDRLKALGAVMDWFCWLDDQCSDSCTKLTPRQVDEVLGVKRLSDALVSVGWARVGEDGLVYVVDFDQHNGETAKNRAQAARRQERFKGNARSVTDGNGCSVTEASANALPRERDVYNNKVDGNATLHSEHAETHPTLPDVDGSYGAWVARVCSALPQLARMRTLPPDVDKAARVMYRTGYTPADGELEALGRFWAATPDKLHGVHRPNAFRWVFESLPDVCRNALEWCRQDDREQRKAAATARRKAKEASVEAERGTSTPEEEKAFFEGVWSDLGEQYRERSGDEEGR